MRSSALALSLFFSLSRELQSLRPFARSATSDGAGSGRCFMAVRGEQFYLTCSASISPTPLLISFSLSLCLSFLSLSAIVLSFADVVVFVAISVSFSTRIFVYFPVTFLGHALTHGRRTVDKQGSAIRVGVDNARAEERIRKREKQRDSKRARERGRERGS